MCQGTLPSLFSHSLAFLYGEMSNFIRNTVGIIWAVPQWLRSPRHEILAWFSGLSIVLCAADLQQYLRSYGQINANKKNDDFSTNRVAQSPLSQVASVQPWNFKSCALEAPWQRLYPFTFVRGRIFSACDGLNIGAFFLYYNRDFVSSTLLLWFAFSCSQHTSSACEKLYFVLKLLSIIIYLIIYNNYI